MLMMMINYNIVVVFLVASLLLMSLLSVLGCFVVAAVDSGNVHVVCFAGCCHRFCCCLWLLSLLFIVICLAVLCALFVPVYSYASVCDVSC